MARVSMRIGELLFAAVLVAPPATAAPSAQNDRGKVAALDVAYQAAVKRNDAVAMDRIFQENFVLVVGNGAVVSREALLKQARDRSRTYERQDEEPGTQTVRVWGDTAVVTAKLWIKGFVNGGPLDEKLWFSDTYVRTPAGWRYAFGQASLPLPPDNRAAGADTTMRPS